MHSTILDSQPSVFTPFSPINQGDLCYGRKPEINRIKKAIVAEGKHIILFGERGSGKTSLANICYKSIKQALPISVVCSQLLDRPHLIWQMVLEKLQIELQNNEEYLKLGINPTLLKETINDTGNKFNRLIYLFKQLKFPLLIVMDEVDLLAHKKENLTSLAETIKAFSDQTPLLTLLLIGIGNKSSELVAEHVSLERCLIEIKLERMLPEPLLDILESGLLKLKINMLLEVKQAIIDFSEGLPFYVHLIAQEAVAQAQKLKYQTVVKKNYNDAIKNIIADRENSLGESYKKAIAFSKDNLYQNILKAAITLTSSELPTSPHIQPNIITTKEHLFEVRELLPLMKNISGKTNHTNSLKSIQTYLNKACTSAKGEIFKKHYYPELHFSTTKSSTQYSFKNPLIKVFIRDMIN